ncbi:HPP family protein [Methanosarcina sp. UBA289]|uniref:HPP family protein n=1 Tax=Methanosarcina sp. UBA289 TaxID=1915574 RepID=UPI0025CCC865|nr:HPP family protein [Methanosarcina sp. UBA289]
MEIMEKRHFNMNPTSGQHEAKNAPSRARRALSILLRSVLGGLLALLAGGLGYITGNLWLFPSLGPSIFMMVESPHIKSSSLYNMTVGHLVGIISGYSIAIITGAAYVQSVFEVGHLQLSHVVASCIAIALVILIHIPLKASHPPAVATTFLITLGSFKATWHDLSAILIGIVIIAIAGEITRHMILSMERRGLIEVIGSG